MFLHIIEGTRDEGKTATGVHIAQEGVLLLGESASWRFHFDGEEPPVRKHAQDVSHALLVDGAVGAYPCVVESQGVLSPDEEALSSEISEYEPLD